MKAPAYLILLLFAAIFTIASCTKDGKLNAPAGQIAADRTKLKINQPDYFALVAADSTKTVNWSVEPGGNDTLTTQRNAARIIFTKAGNYTVKANQAGGASASIGITVIDSVWTQPPTYIKFGTDEQITMTPKYVKSATSDSSYIAFTASTKKSYCTRMALDGGVFYDRNAGAYYIQFTGAYLVGTDCGIGSSILTVHNDFGSYQPKLVNGTYALHIAYGGNPNHDGSIVITDTTITFNWDDANGVIINPKTLNR